MSMIGMMRGAKSNGGGPDRPGGTDGEGCSAEECLARAEQCARAAEHAAYEAQRHRLLWLADRWRHLARLALRTRAAARFH